MTRRRGRPALTEGVPSVVLTTRLRPETATELRNQAKLNGLTVAKLIRLILEDCANNGLISISSSYRDNNVVELDVSD